MPGDRLRERRVGRRGRRRELGRVLGKRAQTVAQLLRQRFREQLGLRLEATRALADIMVVDEVEKPSEN